MHLVPADADTSDADYAFEVQPTGAVDDIIYIMEYDSTATIGDLPDYYVLILGGQFYDEYNVTSNVSGLVVDPNGPIKVAATPFSPAVNYSTGLIEVTERVNPKWSVILRPPTDKVCNLPYASPASPVYLPYISPVSPLHLP